MAQHRKLVALMFTDIVGYSLMTYENEYLTQELVLEYREIVRKLVHKHHGEEHQTVGDAFVIEFSSAVSAVECAIEIQSFLTDRNKHLPEERNFHIRIGIHLGDVIYQDGHFYGTGINMAARVEPFADPGGVCITKQVYDQVYEKLPEVQFKPLGKRKLKNIKSGGDLYNIQFPWSRKKPSYYNNWYTGVLFLITLLSLFKIGQIAFSPQFSHNREPTSNIDAVVEQIDLSKNWEYSLNQKDWEAFDANNNWKYIDVINGEYWLRKKFKYQSAISEPAISLGLISDSHRVYLNGNFIGGSNHLSDLAYYTFDAKILQKDENELLVHAETRATLNPGLTQLHLSPPILSDFSTVRKNVLENQLHFHIVQNIYLAISIVVLLSFLFFLHFNWKDRKYFYSVFVLTLGVLHLTYYQPFVSDALPFFLHRFIKVASISSVPFILFSAYLENIKAKKFTFLNNLFYSAYLITLLVALVSNSENPSQFLKNYNMALSFSLLYCFISIVISCSIELRFLFSKRLRENTWNFQFILFSLMSLLSLTASFKMGWSEYFYASSVRDNLISLGKLSPFLFSCLTIGRGLLDYFIKTTITNRKKDKDHLILEIMRIFQSPSTQDEIIEAVQTKITEFLKATRSTLYLYQPHSDMLLLKSSYKADKYQHRIEYNPHIRPQNGIMAHVLQSKRPLLLKNISDDPRFKKLQLNKKYLTKSCMVFPLICNNEFLGVLSFADKYNFRKFNEEDFQLGLEINTLLSLFISNVVQPNEIKIAA